jgi:hypothetical protein
MTPTRALYRPWGAPRAAQVRRARVRARRALGRLLAAAARRLDPPPHALARSVAAHPAGRRPVDDPTSIAHGRRDLALTWRRRRP